MTATAPHRDVSSSTQHEGSHRRLGEVLRDFPWVHLGIGLFGNALFFIGSILFFWPSVKTIAVWIFVFGSFGMLIGSVGQLFVRIEKHREHHQR